MSITTLPDLGLMTIFDYLPIPDLLQLRKVCSRWSNLQQTACNRRRTLTVLVGKDPLKQILLSSKFPTEEASIRQLFYTKLDPDTLCFLEALIQQTTSLHLVVHDNPATPTLPNLQSFSPNNLRCLSIRLKSSCASESAGQATTIKDRLLELFSYVNSLTTLRRLTIEFDYNILLKSDEVQLPVLAHLEEFYFSSKNDITMLLNAIKGDAEASTSLTKIGVLNQISDRSHLESILKLNVSARFTHLNINVVVNEYTLNRICSKFSNLTYLQLTMTAFGLAQLSQSLAQLTQLSSLKLHIDFATLHKPFLEATELPHLSPLQSIKKLQLTLIMSSHSQPESAYFVVIFPSITSLRLVHHFKHGCWECGRKDYYGVAIEGCVKEIIKPWIEKGGGRCLKRVVTVSGDSGLEKVWPLRRWL